MRTPLVEIRLTGVRMALDRPHHPHANGAGRIWVDVCEAPRGAQTIVEATYHGAPAWLTGEEIAAAHAALSERELLMERGNAAW